MQRTTRSSDRADAARVSLAAGKDAEFVRPEATPRQGGSTDADAAGRGISGPQGKRSGVWEQRFGKDALAVCPGPGTDPPVGASGVLQSVQPAGSRTAGREARLEAESRVEAVVEVRRGDHRRHRLRAAESG